MMDSYLKPILSVIQTEGARAPDAGLETPAQAEGARAPDTGLETPAQAEEAWPSDTGRTQAEGAKALDTGRTQTKGAKVPDTGRTHAEGAKVPDAGRTQAEGIKAPDTGSHTPMEVAHATDVESGSSVQGHQDSGTPDASAAGFQQDKAARRRAKRQRHKAQKRLESLAIQPRSAHANVTAEKGEGTVLPRKRSHGSTPGSVKKPPMKVARTGPPTFASATKKDLAVHVGPVEGEGPITPGEHEWFMRTFKGAILRKESSVVVRVESCTLYNGTIRVICADSATLDWVKAEAKKLVPKPEHNRSAFWVMGPGDLPPTKRYTVWVPDTLAENRAEFVSLLETSNPGLKTRGIHVVLETQRKVPEPSNGKLYVLAVEEATRKQLEELENRPYCGFGRVTFRCKGKASDSSKPQEAGPAESATGGRGIPSSEPMEAPEAD